MLDQFRFHFCCRWNDGNTISEQNGDFSQVEMVFIFIQSLQLQKVPKNLKDIGVGQLSCVTNIDAAATADGMAAIPFPSGMKMSISWKQYYN